MSKTLEQKIADLEQRIVALERAPMRTSVSSPPSKKTLSPKEFLIVHKGSDDVHITFLLCYYAEQILAMESFNITDVEQLFRVARVPVPKNLNDKINKNINKGYLTEAREKKNGKKAWIITMTGEQAFNAKVAP